MVVPPLSALFANSSRQVLGHCRPVSGAVQADEGSHQLVLLRYTPSHTRANTTHQSLEARVTSTGCKRLEHSPAMAACMAILAGAGEDSCPQNASPSRQARRGIPLDSSRKQLEEHSALAGAGLAAPFESAARNAGAGNESISFELVSLSAAWRAVNWPDRECIHPDMTHISQSSSWSVRASHSWPHLGTPRPFVGGGHAGLALALPAFPSLGRHLSGTLRDDDESV